MYVENLDSKQEEYLFKVACVPHVSHMCLTCVSHAPRMCLACVPDVSHMSVPPCLFGVQGIARFYKAKKKHIITTQTVSMTLCALLLARL